jgi:hypothetical protein
MRFDRIWINAGPATLAAAGAGELGIIEPGYAPSMQIIDACLAFARRLN